LYWMLIGKYIYLRFSGFVLKHSRRYDPNLEWQEFLNLWNELLYMGYFIYKGESFSIWERSIVVCKVADYEHPNISLNC
jgi:hypothetical protein